MSITFLCSLHKIECESDIIEYDTKVGLYCYQQNWRGGGGEPNKLLVGDVGLGWITPLGKI